MNGSQKNAELMELSILVENICRRPQMYCEQIASVRDLVFFLSGVTMLPTRQHGGALDVIGDSGFLKFAYQRYNRPTRKVVCVGATARFLLEVFGDKQLFDVCESIGDLMLDWRLTLESPGDGPRNPNPLAVE